MTTAATDSDLERTQPLRPEQLQPTRVVELLAPPAGGAADLDVGDVPGAPEIPEAPGTVTTPSAAPAAPRRAAVLPWPAVAIVAGWLLAIGIVAGSFAVAWWLIQLQWGRPYTRDDGALSLVLRQWVETEPAARLAGVTSIAVASLLVFATATVVLWRRTRAAPVYAAVGTALYVTNPAVIQSALVLDLGGMALVAALALLAAVYVLLLRSPRPVRSPLTWFLMGLATFCLALSLWAEMASPLLLVAAATLYRVVATRPWRPWRLLVEVPAIGILGAGLFSLTWWGAAALTGLPLALPFQTLDLEARTAVESASAWRQNPHLLLDPVSRVAVRVSPYLSLLFVWTALARLADLVIRPVVTLGRRLLHRPSAGEPWGAWPVDFILLAGGAIALAHLVESAAGFPKQHVVMLPFWTAATAYLLSRYVHHLSWWELPIWGIVLSGMAGYFVTFVGDRYVQVRGSDFVFPLLVWPAALGLAFLALGAALGKSHLPRQLAILGVLLTIAWGWSVNLSQARGGYATAGAIPTGDPPTYNLSSEAPAASASPAPSRPSSVSPGFSLGQGP